MKVDEIVKKTILPAVSFLKKVKERDKVLIIHGHDADTICSTVILAKLTEKILKAKVETKVSKLNHKISEDLADNIKNVNHVIIPDIPEINKTVLNKLKNLTKNILIIDHHPPVKYSGVTYCNPRIFEKDIYIPVSYLCYKIYKVFDEDNVEWIAAIGTLSDYGVKNCKDLFKDLKKKYPELIGKNRFSERTLFEKSKLGELVKIIDSAQKIKGLKGVSLVVRILRKSNNYEEIFKSGKKSKILLRYYQITKKEFEKELKNFFKNKKIVGNLILYETKSKLNLHSSLSTYLQQFFKDKILLVYSKKAGKINISFRRGRNLSIDLGELARISTKNFGSGGGHPGAAGAQIPEKKWPDYLKNLVKIVDLEIKKEK